MKYIWQFGLILAFSFLGELLSNCIPLPVPASIYGIVLLFLSLKLHLIPREAVRQTSAFLIEIMPLLFIPAAVGLMDAWGELRASWMKYAVMTVVSTIAVLTVSGLITQAVLRHQGGEKKHD